MAETLVEADLRDFWFKALLEMLYAVPPQVRASAKWYMSTTTWMMLRDIFEAELSLPAFDLPAEWPGGPASLLFGKPVEFVEQDGVTFHG